MTLGSLAGWVEKLDMSDVAICGPLDPGVIGKAVGWPYLNNSRVCVEQNSK